MPNPIQHIVIIVKENHTFDNYFGTFPAVEGAQLTPASNPPSSDPHHDHESWMKRAADSRYHVQYKETDIPDTLPMLVNSRYVITISQR